MKRFIACSLIICMLMPCTLFAEIEPIGTEEAVVNKFEFEKNRPITDLTATYPYFAVSGYTENNELYQGVVMRTEEERDNDKSINKYYTVVEDSVYNGDYSWMVKVWNGRKFAIDGTKAQNTPGDSASVPFKDITFEKGGIYRVSFYTKIATTKERELANLSLGSWATETAFRVSLAYGEKSANYTYTTTMTDIAFSGYSKVIKEADGWQKVSLDVTLTDDIAEGQQPEYIRIIPTAGQNSSGVYYYIDDLTFEKIVSYKNVYNVDNDTELTNIVAKHSDTIELRDAENYSEDNTAGKSLWLSMYEDCLFWVNGMFNGLDTSLNTKYRVSYMAKIDSTEELDVANMGLNIYYDSSGTRTVLKEFATNQPINKTGWSRIEAEFAITDPLKTPTEIGIFCDTYVNVYVDDITVEKITVTENIRTFNDDDFLSDYEAKYSDTIALTDAENASPEGEAGKSVWINKGNDCHFWFGGIFSGIEFEKESIYRVSYMAKVDSSEENPNSETNLGMNIYYPDATTGTRTILYTSDADTLVIKDDWTKVSFEFKVTDLTYKPTEIGIVASNFVMLYIDDISVVEITDGMRVANIYSDNMVFQRGEEINIWGYGNKDGDTVTVSIIDKDNITLQTQNATVANKKWSVTFPAMTAQKDLKIIVSDGAENLVYSNIAIGDVWVLSGQSNMEMMMEDLYGVEDYITESDNYDIRFMDIELNISFEEEEETYNSTWRKVNSNNVGIVSGIGYMFAQELAKEVDVPIGIIKNYRGGMFILPFMSMETLEKRPEYASAIITFNQQKANTTYSWSSIPVAFYNAMTSPILPFGVKGVLWYQGESDAMNNLADVYDMKLTDYIAQWRSDFNNPTLPFIVVQLTPYKNSDYRALRQVQLDVAKKDENVYLATSAYEGPCGHETQGAIHPAYKNPIAQRAAKAALVNIYAGECDVTGEYQGPEYMDMTVEGNNAILTFSHIGEGLKSAVDGEALKGFEISSDGETYVTATAEIDGDKIKVYADGVENPVEVRYAYVTCADDNTLGGNLTNNTLIPASPFRASLYAPTFDAVNAENTSDGVSYSYYINNLGYSTGEVYAVTAAYGTNGLIDVDLTDITHHTIGKVLVEGTLDTNNQENVTVRNFVFYSMSALNNIS